MKTIFGIHDGFFQTSFLVDGDFGCWFLMSLEFHWTIFWKNDDGVMYFEKEKDQSVCKNGLYYLRRFFSKPHYDG